MLLPWPGSSGMERRNDARVWEGVAVTSVLCRTPLTRRGCRKYSIAAYGIRKECDGQAMAVPRALVQDEGGDSERLDGATSRFPPLAVRRGGAPRPSVEAQAQPRFPAQELLQGMPRS